MSRSTCARCDFTGDDRQQLREHAAESGHWLCIICYHSLADDETQTCMACMARTRTHLADIPDLYALLPVVMQDRAGAAAPLDASGVRGDSSHPLPGGEALALLGGGAGRWLADRGDTPSALGVLALWEDDWRITRGEPPAGAATMAEASAYLIPRLTWAASHHPAFDEFAKDIRELAGHLRRATGRQETLDRGIACPDCGERLVRHYRDPRPCPAGCTHDGPGHDQGGRTDDWQCPNRSCGRIVTEREYNFAVWAHLQEREAAC